MKFRRRKIRGSAPSDEALRSLLTESDWDDIADAAANPALDRIPRRAGKAVERVLSILDELTPGLTNGRKEDQ